MKRCVCLAWHPIVTKSLITSQTNLFHRLGGEHIPSKSYHCISHNIDICGWEYCNSRNSTLLVWTITTHNHEKTGNARLTNYGTIVKMRTWIKKMYLKNSQTNSSVGRSTHNVHKYSHQNILTVEKYYQLKVLVAEEIFSKYYLIMINCLD